MLNHALSNHHPCPLLVEFVGFSQFWVTLDTTNTKGYNDAVRSALSFEFDVYWIHIKQSPWVFTQINRLLYIYEEKSKVR